MKEWVYKITLYTAINQINNPIPAIILQKSSTESGQKSESPTFFGCCFKKDYFIYFEHKITCYSWHTQSIIFNKQDRNILTYIIVLI